MSAKSDTLPGSSNRAAVTRGAHYGLELLMSYNQDSHANHRFVQANLLGGHIGANLSSSERRGSLEDGQRAVTGRYLGSCTFFRALVELLTCQGV